MAGVASKVSNNFLNIRTLFTPYNSLLLKLYSGYVLHNTNLRNGIFFPILFPGIKFRDIFPTLTKPNIKNSIS